MWYRTNQSEFVFLHLEITNTEAMVQKQPRTTVRTYCDKSGTCATIAGNCFDFESVDDVHFNNNGGGTC